MSDIYMESDRSFQIWAYSVSHNQLLIRSPKSRHDPENVDVFFGGVLLMNLRSGFVGLSITDALPDEVEGLRRHLRDPASPCHFYALISEGRRYFVAAAAIRVSSNELDLRETELDFMAFVKPGQRIVE